VIVAEASKIEWTDATFNPWIGCTNISPGCDHCYAEAQDKFRGWTPAGWGAGKPRRRTSEQLWKQPLKWNDDPFFECVDCGFRGNAVDMGREPHGPCSHGVTKQVRRRVFCASLADVFDNEVDPQWRADLFSLILRTPNLDWLLLTKRIGNVRPMLEQICHPSDPDLPIWDMLPLANVWLGATIVDREELLRDASKLKAIPARVRFWSVEPMLGDLGQAPRELMPDWVIVGGESGPSAKPMHPDWPRSLRDQCAAAGVPFLFKQHGEWVEIDTGLPEPLVARVGDPEFDDAADKHDGFLTIDGHFVRQIEDMQDDVPYRGLVRVGKKAAGRALDGVMHDGFPEAVH
jgi:protein gp37